MMTAPVWNPVTFQLRKKIYAVCTRGLHYCSSVASIIGVSGLLFWVTDEEVALPLLPSCTPFHLTRNCLTMGTHLFISDLLKECAPFHLLMNPMFMCTPKMYICVYFPSTLQSDLCHHQSGLRDNISVLSSQIFLDFLMKFCFHFLPATWFLPFVPIWNILQSLTDKGQGCRIKRSHHHDSQVHHSSGNCCGVVWVLHVVWVNGRTGNVGAKCWRCDCGADGDRWCILWLHELVEFCFDGWKCRLGRLLWLMVQSCSDSFLLWV